MMDFEIYLQKQIQMHPSVQPRDIVKLCYQAAFGAEHLLQDMERAKTYLQAEYDAVEGKEQLLYEPISADICRVNLAAWKWHGLPVSWLFPMLAVSPFSVAEREGVFFSYLQRAETVLQQTSVGFSAAAFQTYVQEYLQVGLAPVHHSPQYREQESPAYRIVNRRWMKLLPVLEQTARVLSEKGRCIIAIDGRAASGKTTMAKQLQQILQAEIIEMDDFFLPMELRTQERFAQPGGNIHWERFQEEVLPYLDEPFSYRIFDCSQMDYNGRREIGTSPVRIVEGSYSCHPLFGRYADITVFSEVTAEEQRARILRRNGEAMAEMFRERWIPMEEAYFTCYRIAEQADIRMETFDDKDGKA